MDKLTANKFEAVTGYSMEDYIQFTSSKQYDRYKTDYNIEKFKNILVLTPLNEFSDQLYYYLILTKGKVDHFKFRNTRYNENYKHDLSYKMELVEVLKNILSGGKLKATITNIPKSQVIQTKKVLDLIQAAAVSSLRNTINELGLNEHPLSIDMAIEEINNHSDIRWVERWMESTGYIDPTIESFTLEKFDEYFNKLNFSLALPGVRDSMREEMIIEYAYDHFQKNDLDIKELNRIRAKIKEELSKAGPKEDTYFQKHVAYSLSILLRLDKFLEDKSIKTIDEISIENTDLRFIHDIMCFFNIITDYRETAYLMKILEKRIRKMIGDFKDLITIEEHNQKLLVLKFLLLNEEHNLPD